MMIQSSGGISSLEKKLQFNSFLETFDTTASLELSILRLLERLTLNGELREAILRLCPSNQSQKKVVFWFSRETGFSYWDENSGNTIPESISIVLQDNRIGENASCFHDYISVPLMFADGTLYLCGTNHLQQQDQLHDIEGVFQSIGHFLGFIIKQAQLVDNTLRKQKESTAIALISSLAHDIKNPLAGLSGFMQLLLQRVHDDFITKYQSMIQGSLAKIERVPLELLSIIKNNPISIAKIEFCLSDAIREFFVPKVVKLQQEGINLVVECTARVYIIGEWERLRTALDHLLTNAYEALQGDSKEISLRVHPHSNNVVINIEDNGCGIPIYIMDSLGRPFFSFRKDGHKGLGLSYVYAVIRAHEGSVGIISTVGKRTCVTVSIPRICKEEEGELSSI
ncbi:MAG: HAMP domain-containing histidine kinase [Chitinivibrionales bacterium]|nr:HAMP domain-containing histidine kinase [Chitinivibrionales bacterium]